MNATRLQHLLRGLQKRMAILLDRFDPGAGPGGEPTPVAAEPADVSPKSGAAEERNTSEGQPDSLEHDPEEVDLLVRLTFNALLRRDPGEEILVAYREGFAKGTTVHGLIDDILGSDEYRAARERARRLRALPAAAADGWCEPVRLGDMQAAVQQFETRLAAAGCQLPRGAVEQVMDAADPENPRRMRGLRLTLTMLDRL